MKKALSAVVFLCCFSASGCFGQNTADFSIRVTDDDGLPVSNATVGVTYVTAGGFIGRDGRALQDIHTTVEGLTDTNGVYHYRGAFNAENGWGVRKEGYYDAEYLKIQFTSVAFGRLQPWGKQYDVTLRRIVKPIAMYATTMCDPRPVKIPELSKPYGFDLMKSDWVAPFGKGEKADFIFKLDSCDAKVPPGYYEMYPRAIRRKNETLTVAFSNPDDGIQGFISAPRQGSTFRSPRYAPESGYETNYVSLDRMDEGNQRNDKANENQNYIFRVRTMRDEHGAITNAFYGKIYGPICYMAPFVGCTYYLNPTSLDRNLEFDRTKNLLQGVVDQRQLPSEP